MSTTIATLRSPGIEEQHWRWEISGTARRSGFEVPLPSADPRRLLVALAEVDRTHGGSTTNVAVHGRYVVVERFLDAVWRELVEPLVDELPEPGGLRLRVPAALHRLPFTTARCTRSGESPIHLCEPVVEWSLHTAEPSPVPAAGSALRFDGHLRDVARALTRRRPEPGATLLLLGCRTAELLPWLPERHSAWAVVSSWDVDDQQCGALGDLIQEGLASGLLLPAALRSAQARLSDRHPYEWAGYSAVALTGSAGALPREAA